MRDTLTQPTDRIQPTKRPIDRVQSARWRLWNANSTNWLTESEDETTAVGEPMRGAPFLSVNLAHRSAVAAKSDSVRCRRRSFTMHAKNVAHRKCHDWLKGHGDSSLCACVEWTAGYRSSLPVHQFNEAIVTRIPL
jgi:hypothetical protein